MENREEALSEGRDRSSKLRVALVLGAVTVVGTVTALPYVAAVLAAGEVMVASGNSAAILASSALCDRLLPSLVAIGVGLWLGDRVGLGAPVLRGWLAGNDDVKRRLPSLLWQSTLIGIAGGIGVMLLSPLGIVLAPALSNSEAAAEAALIAPWKGALVAFSAGVIEELQFRFGLMTFCVWLGARLIRRQRPGQGLIWLSNILAVLPFGLLHLGNMVALDVEITVGAVAFVLLMNGLIGLVFGWVYWRRGLLAAMWTHLSTDIILKVIVPFIGALAT